MHITDFQCIPTSGYKKQQYFQYAFKVYTKEARLQNLYWRYRIKLTESAKLLGMMKANQKNGENVIRIDPEPFLGDFDTHTHTTLFYIYNMPASR